MPETVPLYSWWSSGATDNLASSRPEWRPWMRPEGYRFSHTIGTVLAPSAPAPESTRGLHRWYSRERRDHVTSARFEPGTPPDPSYAYVGLEGHVYTRPLLGTTPLYSWFSHDRSDNFLTTRAEWVAEPGSVQHGYRCWGVEGYVFPVDRSHTPDPVAFTHHPGWSPTLHSRDSGVLRGRLPVLTVLVDLADRPLQFSQVHLEQLIHGSPRLGEEGTVPLSHWFSARGDHHRTTSELDWRGDRPARPATANRFVRVEGFLADPAREAPPGTIPLWSRYRPAPAEDNVTTTTPGDGSTLQGYILPTFPEVPGTVGLHLWRAPGDTYTTTHPSWRGAAGARRGAYAWQALLGRVRTEAAPGDVPLIHRYRADVDDNVTLSGPAWFTVSVHPPDYVLLAIEGRVFDPAVAAPPGTLPLVARFSRDRGDDRLGTDPVWTSSTKTAPGGYGPGRLQGYVFDQKRAPAGSVALESWVSADGRRQVATTSGGLSAANPPAAGYRFDRILGHVVAPDQVSGSADEQFSVLSRGRQRLASLGTVRIRLAWTERQVGRIEGSQQLAAFDADVMAAVLATGAIREAEASGKVVQCFIPSIGPETGQMRAAKVWSEDGTATRPMSPAPVYIVNSEAADVALASHELSHALRLTVDIYGPGAAVNARAAYTGPSYLLTDSPGHVTLDPWHRLLARWDLPVVRRLTDASRVAPVRLGTPLLLYDPRRGIREFFLIEHRERGAFGRAWFDAGGLGTGIAVWYVQVDGQGRLVKFTWPPPIGDDRGPRPDALAHYLVPPDDDDRPPAGRFGRGPLWGAATNPVSRTVVWGDGSPAFRLTVGDPGGAAAGATPGTVVQWSLPGRTAAPRLDVVTGSATDFRLTGSFPIACGSVFGAAAERLRVRMGAATELAPVSVTPEEVRVAAPLPAVGTPVAVTVGSGSWPTATSNTVLVSRP